MVYYAPKSPSLPDTQADRWMGRERTSVVAAEGGWMEFRCLGYCLAEDASRVAELRQGASHQDNRYSCDQRLELRAETRY